MKDYDQIAWECIRAWPEKSGFNPLVDGLNYWELTQSFLRDKVGRALRFKLGDPSVSLEREMLVASGWEPSDFKRVTSEIAGIRSASCLHASWPYSYMEALRRLSKLAKIKIRREWRHRRGGSRKVVFIPYLSRPLNAVGKKLGADCRKVVLSKDNPAAIPQIVPFSLECFRCERQVKADIVTSAVVDGLSLNQIDLFVGDIRMLKSQVGRLMVEINYSETELVQLAPDVIIVHADNHPPHQVYVAMANRLQIPCLMIQHGLDCERFVLEDAYASDIAVWGEARSKRYRQYSISHSNLYVTGNPAYDSLRLPDSVSRDGEYWLWLTRPHGPEKCYGVSRSVDEGVKIMRSLLNAMKLFPTARLVVKPHPYDYIERYKAMVERDVSRDRIVFTEKDSLEVLSGAKFVITEDSTAGMEAMFFGKPLIHVHFGSAGTTIPFVELGCALRAYDERELIHAIGEVNSWVLGAGDDLLQAQRKFLLQFAGPCDGQASQRVVSLVEKLCAV